MIIEIDADSILSLIFLSVGVKQLIDIKTINKFIKKLTDLNNNEYYFMIDFPMNNNFNNNLFLEIDKGSDKGKIKYISKKSDDLFYNLFNLCNSNKETLVFFRHAITEFSYEYKVSKQVEKKEKIKTYFIK